MFILGDFPLHVLEKQMGAFGGALINKISIRNAFKESRLLLCYELKRKKEEGFLMEFLAQYYVTKRVIFEKSFIKLLFRNHFE